MLLRKTFHASAEQKDTRDFSPVSTSLVAVSMRLPNGEAEDGLKLRERWIRRVSLLVKPVLCPELWYPLSSFAGLGIAAQPLMEAGPSARRERVGSRLKGTGKLQAIFPLG